MALTRTERHDLNRQLAEAVTAVYDCHNTALSRRIPITDHPRYGDLLALHNARLVADTHATHEGSWPLGSCDAELFQLEWLIYMYDKLDEAPRPSLWQRCQRRFIHALGSLTPDR